jgi:hypothetical protein
MTIVPCYMLTGSIGSLASGRSDARFEDRAPPWGRAKGAILGPGHWCYRWRYSQCICLPTLHSVCSFVFVLLAEESPAPRGAGKSSKFMRADNSLCISQSLYCPRRLVSSADGLRVDIHGEAGHWARAPTYGTGMGDRGRYSLRLHHCHPYGVPWKEMALLHSRRNCCGSG